MEHKHIEETSSKNEIPSKNETPKAQISADAKESRPTRTLTVEPPPERVKNPIKVAQGKHLAEMSRNRKRKAQTTNKVVQRQQREDETEESLEEASSTSQEDVGISFNTTAVVITTCATVLSAYIGYKQWKNSEAEPTKESTRKRRDTNDTEELREVSTVRDNLNDLDKYAL